MNGFLTFLIDWSLRSAITVALAALFVTLLGARSAATKHLIWRIALAVVLLLPIGMPLVNRLGAPPVIEPIQAPIRTALAPLPPQPLKPVSPLTASVMRRALDDPQREFGVQWICIAYGIGLFALMAGWVRGYARIRAVAKTAQPYAGLTSAATMFVEEIPSFAFPSLSASSNPSSCSQESPALGRKAGSERRFFTSKRTSPAEIGLG